MTLKLGAYTACLHDRLLADALGVLASNGLTSVEVNTGGFIPSPHCHVNIEHEDASYSRLEGLALAAGNLRAAAATM
jgi:phosphoglucomutase